MISNREAFKKITDQSGNAYLCPVDNDQHPGRVDGEIPEDCVDIDTVGRYAGNIEVIYEG
ncbi:MAG: hypothetical protein R6W95_06520 [Desulfosarcina sp.]